MYNIVCFLQLFTLTITSCSCALLEPDNFKMTGRAAYGQRAAGCRLLFTRYKQCDRRPLGAGQPAPAVGTSCQTSRFVRSTCCRRRHGYASHHVVPVNVYVNRVYGCQSRGF